MPDRIETVKRFTMGAVGWVKTVKGGGWAGLQAVITGALLAWGWPEVTAVVVGAAASAGINALREYAKEYKIVKTD